MDQKRDDLKIEYSRLETVGEPLTDSRERWLWQLGVILLLIGVGGLGYLLLKNSKPSVEKREAEIPVPAVQVWNVKTGPQKVWVRGQGSVSPLNETQVVPQVSGKVVSISPTLVNGGSVKAGETLIRIDPEDYALAVTLAEARVRDGESKFALALQESEAAVQEWEDLYPGTEPPDLVARKPQLAAARAMLDGERADLTKARLQLNRTRLTAPFDGIVSSKTVDAGQFVSPGQVLASIYSTQVAEIVTPLETENLSWFHIPGFTPGQDAGSPAVVRVDIAGREMVWDGRVVRAEGKVDEKSRMINVVVQVPEPFSRKPPLAIGLFARVDIEGKTLENASLIPRSALRDGNRVWVVDGEDRLRFRDIDVARLTSDGVLVTSGLVEGERVVTSPIRAVVDGMRVRPLPHKES